MADIGAQAFIFDHYHRKIRYGSGVSCPLCEDGKAALKDGSVLSVSKESGTAEVGFIGGDLKVVKGTNLVKHIGNDKG